MELIQAAQEWDTVSPAIALGERQSQRNISDFSTDARAIWNANKDATKCIELIGMQPCSDIDFLDLPCNIEMLKMIKKEEDSVNDCVMVSISILTLIIFILCTHQSTLSSRLPRWQIQHIPRS